MSVSTTPAEAVANRLRELKVQFIRRATDQHALLGASIAQVEAGVDCRPDIKSVAHSLAGSGALFGFSAISTAAGKVEDAILRGDPLPDIATATIHLTSVIEAAIDGFHQSTGDSPAAQQQVA